MSVCLESATKWDFKSFCWQLSPAQSPPTLTHVQQDSSQLYERLFQPGRPASSQRHWLSADLRSTFAERALNKTGRCRGRRGTSLDPAVTSVRASFSSADAIMFGWKMNCIVRSSLKTKMSSIDGELVGSVLAPTGSLSSKGNKIAERTQPALPCAILLSSSARRRPCRFLSAFSIFQ